ncbi:MAG: hypothetical protein IPM50_02760 [Acidobacteriota bacterium]|nr:MAG: hypothetical protein IPM50_02760 [Acidobacteriota bacterium]
MTTIARITVIKCDGLGCTAVISRHSLTVDDGWVGAIRHFCPACKDSVLNAAAVENDRLTAESVLKRAFRRQPETTGRTEEKHVVSA